MDPITAYLIQLVIGLVISGVTTLAQQAFAPKPKAQNQQPGMRGQYSTGGTVPMTIVLGTYGIAGQLEYSNTWGKVNETPNAYLVDVISLADYQISDVTAVWLDSQSVTLSGSGALTRGFPFPEKALSGTDYAWYKFHFGDQSTAETYLLDKFSADSKRPWLSDMIGEGISYAIQTARIHEKLWTDFPRYMYQVQGAPVFDPRLSTAAGGSGSQVWGTFSTYTFSDNPVVLIYNILRGLHDADGSHMWGGHATAYQLPYAEWAAAMNLCDELVALKAGGTEKRYRAGIEISLNERPADVIRELLVACNARAGFSRGQFHILVDVPASAAGSFTDDDLLIEEPIDFSQFPNLDDVVNGVAATFLAPQRAWEERETKPYYRSDLATEDGQPYRQKLQLRCVFSGSQAQRIIKAAVEEGRRFKRAVVCLPPDYEQYRPLQALAWTSDEFQYSSKLFLIISRTEDEWGRIWFALQEIDPSDFDWDEETDETELTFAETDESPVPVQGADDFDAEGTVFVDNDGISRGPGIMVSFAPDLDDVRAVRVQVVLDGSADVVFEGDLPYDPDAAVDILLPKEFLPATAYEARGRYIPFDGSGRDTTWSIWTPLTTPDVGLGLIDIGEDLRAWQQRAANSIREVRDTLTRIDQLVANGVSTGKIDVKRVREEMATQFADLTANYTRTIDVLTTDTKAIAIRVESLNATLGDVASATALSALTVEVEDLAGDVLVNAAAITALEGVVGYESGSATFRLDLSYTPSAGWTNGWALQARVDSGSSWRSIGIYGEVTASAGRIVLDADSIVISNGGTPVALFESGQTYLAAARIGDASITTAKIGDLQVTTIKIGNTQVTDAKILEGAVTDPIVDSQTGGNLPYYNSYQTILSISITAGAYPIPVGCFLDWTTYASATTNTYDVVLEVIVSSVAVEIDLETRTSVSSGTRGSWLLSGTIPPLPAGSYTVRVRMKSNVGTSTDVHVCHYIVLAAGSVKK
jgi:hypothetical protein